MSRLMQLEVSGSPVDGGQDRCRRDGFVGHAVGAGDARAHLVAATMHGAASPGIARETQLSAWRIVRPRCKVPRQVYR